MASTSTEDAVKDMEKAEQDIRQICKQLNHQSVDVQNTVIDMQNRKLDPGGIDPLLDAMERATFNCELCQQVIVNIRGKLQDAQIYVHNVYGQTDVRRRSIVCRKCDSGISSMGSNPGSAVLTEIQLHQSNTYEWDIDDDPQISDGDVHKEIKDMEEITKENADIELSTDSDPDDQNNHVVELFADELHQSSPQNPMVQHDSTNQHNEITTECHLNNLSGSTMMSSYTGNESPEYEPRVPPFLESLAIDTTEDLQPEEAVTFTNPCYDSHK